VHKNLPSECAVDELINLIKENGDWVDERLVSGRAVTGEW